MGKGLVLAEMLKCLVKLACHASLLGNRRPNQFTLPSTPSTRSLRRWSQTK